MNQIILQLIRTETKKGEGKHMKESILELLKDIEEGVAQNDLQKIKNIVKALGEILKSEYVCESYSFEYHELRGA